MRFNITLNRTSRQHMLPMDYPYYISAWIYKVLKQADPGFARFLHDEGYGKSETKLYKLFCFSRLNFGKPKLWKEKKLFEIEANDIGLQIGFDVPEAAANFIKGLFMSQEFYLGDRFNGIDFRVTGVEAQPEPGFTPTMCYRMQTPWVVSLQTETNRHPQYLSADNERFLSLAIKHIAEKYNNTGKRLPVDLSKIGIKRTSDFKRSGILIKPGSKNETRVVGNLFSFELIAPIEVHQMVWCAGVSEKSSSGFGWVEILKPDRFS